ncbi:MAG: ACP S-malonyltransferase [Burkholderiaceae bacterium]
MTAAFLFPGQGSQAVGMLSSLARRPEVARLLETADRVLGESLSTMIADGPADALALTANTQPAMLVAGLSCFEAWRADGGPLPAFMAGHSLGEYTALTAAGAIDADRAISLVRLRANAMQQAVPVGSGAMAAILGLNDDQVREACDRARENGPNAQRAASGADLVEVVEPANFNAPSQVVIAGHKAAVERACEAAKAMGAKRAMLLAVSAPFHSSLLEPAGRVLAAALTDVPLRSPAVAVVNNVDVAIETDPDRIRDALVRQASRPVRWVETIELLVERGVDRFIEFGPGRVLAGLVRRIVPSATAEAVHDAESLAKALGAAASGAART